MAATILPSLIQSSIPGVLEMIRSIVSPASSSRFIAEVATNLVTSLCPESRSNCGPSSLKTAVNGPGAMTPTSTASAAKPCDSRIVAPILAAARNVVRMVSSVQANDAVNLPDDSKRSVAAGRAGSTGR